jgi:hypothetical protein
MKSVSPRLHLAAHRFGIVSRAGGRKVGALSRDPRAKPSHELRIFDFALPSGEVVARQVEVLGRCECWLRADLAELAEQALAAEQAESARIAAEVVSYSLGRDSDRAADAGMTVEQYRNQRNSALQRIDLRRGRQNAGMS